MPRLATNSNIHTRNNNNSLSYEQCENTDRGSNAISKFLHLGLYQYYMIVLKFNFPNQVTHNRDMCKWNQLEKIPLAKSGTINLNTKIMIGIDYNPLNRARLHES